jgi:hypothetical protein
LLWSILLMLDGFLSVLSWVLVPVNSLAVAAAWVQVRPGKEADAARLRLEEQGMDFGA